ncbi:sulfite exporter TauE/SafE family protein [Psychrosphaera sp. B3R10]|uniref:sulfite exporter TauE/SafE family protein n=1 Tax=unclassified Psychrosphaera TaxID=2641570 RepID=UPI001C0A5478|nr:MULTISPECIES: sulfite exporter TauE/SafE family protein [unclassified Psychrosphaera]MBU2882840.1 sulfite exporter TauE/SafE family protein [Psychrosphaera sp. I2R16]MBU2990421.1 sulfite exporter TauE/SafE family protein [Psychrosphaera sp. B3R10]
MEVLIYLPFMGMLAGFLAGLLGIGGGIVLVPVLIYLLPILPMVNEDNVAILAIATSLATVIVTAFSSSKSHFKKGNVDIRFALPVVVAAALTSIIASHVAALLASKTLTLIFAIMLMILSVQTFRGGKKLNLEGVVPSKLQLIFGGSLTGFLASLAGLGGGAILVPYLTYIGVGIRKSIGTAALCSMVVALFGSSGYLIAGWHWTESDQFIGFIHWPSALCITLFSYFAAPFGVKVGQSLDQVQLKKVFAVFMVIVSVKLLVEQFI